MNFSGLLQQARIMGILNVTPDSFSDGGDFFDIADACAHAKRMVADGAAIIDIGGESTRPGAAQAPAEEQLRRVIPVIESLRAELAADIVLSIDARDPVVADKALEAGAGLINDISAGSDPEMLALAASHQVPIVLMHMQGTPGTMQVAPAYTDVVREVSEYLAVQAQRAIDAGVAPDMIIVDPGIGFGKTRAHNLALIDGLATIVALGYPVLLGTSRKRFMGAICREREFKQLVGATCATTVIGAQAGVSIFRVHDVRENRQALELVLALDDAAQA